jgi:hypothetical protein
LEPVNSEPVEKPRANNRFSDKEWVLSERVDPRFNRGFASSPIPEKQAVSEEKGFSRAPFVPESLIGDGYFPKVSSQEMFKNWESPVRNLIIANNNLSLHEKLFF